MNYKKSPFNFHLCLFLFSLLTIFVVTNLHHIIVPKQYNKFANIILSIIINCFTNIRGGWVWWILKWNIRFRFIEAPKTSSTVFIFLNYFFFSTKHKLKTTTNSFSKYVIKKNNKLNVLRTTYGMWSIIDEHSSSYNIEGILLSTRIYIKKYIRLMWHNSTIFFCMFYVVVFRDYSFFLLLSRDIWWLCFIFKVLMHVFF